MNKNTTIKGIIFDYGATIDTQGVHWAEVLWQHYEKVALPISKEQFREAYVYAERELAKHPHIETSDNFLQVLRKKIALEMHFLIREGHLTGSDEYIAENIERIARLCNEYVLDTLTHTRPVIQALSKKFPLVLVSNFYGNIHAVLKEYRLEEYFKEVIESSVVGVRKPNPEIFQLGIDALGLPAEEVLVVGDSFKKDILPARQLRCQTAWLEGLGWTEESVDKSVPSIVIHQLSDLMSAIPV